VLEDASVFDIVAELPLADLRSAQLLVSEPDMIIVDVQQTSVAAVNALLYERCSTRVLGISADGQQGTLYEMRPQRVVLGELTPVALVAALRRSHGDDA
jgi:hypothetical protein